jgi:drug/metabolite transporter (DMT)-like permease
LFKGILAPIFLKEPFSFVSVYAGIISLFGVFLISKPETIFGKHQGVEEGAGGKQVTMEQRISAVAVGLLGVLGATGAFLVIRKIGKRANALHSISYFSIYSVIISILIAIFTRTPPVLPNKIEYWFLILVIGVCGFAAQVLVTMGLQRENAGRASVGTYTHLVFALLLERMVFHHVPDVLSLFGSALIMLAAFWVVFDKSNKDGRRPAVERTGGGDAGQTMTVGISTFGGEEVGLNLADKVNSESQSDLEARQMGGVFRLDEDAEEKNEDRDGNVVDQKQPEGKV